MFTRIVVPLDGTEHAERALPVASRIARATDGSLLLVRVVLPPLEYGMYGFAPVQVVESTPYEIAIDEATSYMSQLLYSNEALFAGIKMETHEIAGAASPIVFQEARAYHADLIVLCSRGETGLKRWAFSSMAQQAIRHSPVSVLVLNEHGHFPPFQPLERPLRVLLPLDGSPLAETALEPTIQFLAMLAGTQQATLHLLRVVDMPFSYGKTRSFSHVDELMQAEEVSRAQSYLHEVMGRVQTMLPAGCNLTLGSSVAVDVDVVKAILTEAGAIEDGRAAESYDLVAIATHGRSGVSRMLMGSVSEGLLGTTRLPLFFVRPQKESVMPTKDAEIRS
jgi:nucleotide-binding universal stress UspA family protein